MTDVNSMLADQKRTSVFIAHRLRTISNAGPSAPPCSPARLDLARWLVVSPADHIIVLHKGEVVEAGTHEELLARSSSEGAIYKGLWETQLSLDANWVLDVFQSEHREPSSKAP
jgi:ATP-binding cassette subfamily B (MDR/TAP) protein 7